MTVQVVRYGASPDQEGDLHLPAAGRPPVVCLLHGGFWRLPWARDQMNAMAVSLGVPRSASEGFAAFVGRLTQLLAAR
jgi:acetyl esterase/lipase